MAGRGRVKLFVGFVVLCFLLGMAADSWRPRRLAVLLGGIGVGVCMAYFFLHQI